MNSKNEIYAIILAAGSGSRLAKHIDIKKQFINYKNNPLWWQSVLTFYNSPKIKGIVLVFPPQDDEYLVACEKAKKLHAHHNLAIPFYYTKGGESRFDSVYEGLKKLPSNCDFVLIHDSARPFFSANLQEKLISVLQEHMISAVIPSLEVTDTIKLVETVSSQNIMKKMEKMEKVEKTLVRKQLRAIQTPQAFNKSELLFAHENIRKNPISGLEITDDAMLMELSGFTVFTIQGEANNIKITNQKDLELLETKTVKIPCNGYGYDVHKFGGDRPFVLGGVNIPTKLTIQAHSDGDVLIHALIDALLSCLCLGDIGTLFPDTDPKYENISSLILLDKVMTIWKQHKLELCHVDLTVITQSPKISPHANEIKKNIARLLEVNLDMINVKATTEEKLGFTGQKLGIKAVALVSALKSV